MSRVFCLFLGIAALPLIARADDAPARDHPHHSMAPVEAAQTEVAEVSSETSPVAPVTPAMRAAAFPDLGGMSMSDHMIEDPLTGMLAVNRFERQSGDGADPFAWDLQGWLGHDSQRLWLRSEGERTSGVTHGDASLLWGHPIAPWWDVLIGVRTDFGGGPARQWAAFGVQGMAPYRIEVAATAYVGEAGRAALRLEASYDLRLSQRWILQPRIEANLYRRADAARDTGAGLDGVEAGLRLRYEIAREFAPYVGVERQRAADERFGASGRRTETRLIAGLRFWF